MKTLKTIQDFDRLIKKAESFIIYKHSPVCIVANNACSNVETAITNIEHAHDVIYKVDVIEDKNISNHIAEFSHVKHESPQIILFEKAENGHLAATEYVSHGLISQPYVQGVVNRALGKKSVDFGTKE